MKAVRVYLQNGQREARKLEAESSQDVDWCDSPARPAKAYAIRRDFFTGMRRIVHGMADEAAILNKRL